MSVGLHRIWTMVRVQWMAAIVIFICRTLGTGWKVKKPLCFSLFGPHCHCSLSINTKQQRKWVDACWKGHEGSVQGKCRLFDVLLGHSKLLRNPSGLEFASCWMSTFSEVWHPRGRSWEKAQVWVGLPPKKKLPKECGGLGLESSIAFCEGVQDLRCSLGGLSFQRRQVLEKGLLLEEKSKGIFIFSFLFWFCFCQGAGVESGEDGTVPRRTQNSSANLLS